MFILKVSCWVAGPEAEVHGIDYKSVSKNLLQAEDIRINMVFGPWLKRYALFFDLILYIPYEILNFGFAYSDRFSNLLIHILILVKL